MMLIVSDFTLVFVVPLSFDIYWLLILDCNLAPSYTPWTDGHVQGKSCCKIDVNGFDSDAVHVESYLAKFFIELNSGRFNKSFFLMSLANLCPHEKRSAAAA